MADIIQLAALSVLVGLVGEDARHVTATGVMAAWLLPPLLATLFLTYLAATKLRHAPHALVCALLAATLAVQVRLTWPKDKHPPATNFPTNNN
jgi:hypothetical protein